MKTLGGAEPDAIFRKPCGLAWEEKVQDMAEWVDAEPPQ